MARFVGIHYVFVGSFVTRTKWAVLLKRWGVERTFSWLGNFRGLSKDFEILPATTENMIRIAMLKITLEN